MRRLFAVIIIGCTLGVMSLLSARADELAGERRRVLDNGLEVVVVPSTRSKAVVVVTCYRAGARDEARDESGAAQLVARLYRRSAAGTRPAGGAELDLTGLAGKVATGLASSLMGANVHHDSTLFYATAPEDGLATVLEVERDRMASLAPTPELLEDSRGEVLFESARAEAMPRSRATAALDQLAFGDSGLGRPATGTSKTVGSLKLPALEAWRKARFRPDAALVVIAGVREPDQALEKAAKILGAVARPAEPLAARPAVPPLPGGTSRVVIEGATVDRQVFCAFRGPDAGSDDEAAFLALSFELKDRLGSALKGLAQKAHASADTRSDTPALLIVEATPRAASAIADVESRIAATVASVRDDAALPADRLRERVRRVLEGLTRPLDASVGKTDDPAKLVDAACDRAVAAPLLRRRPSLEKRLETLTPAALQKAAGVYLAPDRARWVIVGK